ncbi:Tol-Pal system beta propeller repeat protein TolB [Alkalilimnicola ehrlichii]|uniref:Tol-Pal system protein TolB n=1 Tax=Alkalilimnicola ehrlichii TaxID=351052 RepID=A0A3E0X3F9_9GAMM|nr:Tol-Pal system beta propeller repeat protein TolB [Alkalilimnicola ehrlichii]RFA31345.1 Tol-Pal system beta propeller repeat protein TolB [Alkalilimnicola ehrlichii]RFA39380.1 Tol-Pal system beta propeller repeat protein TolB [Alkalilimnicola ehrlichii]
MMDQRKQPRFLRAFIAAALVVAYALTGNAQGQLMLDITGGVERAVPIAVVPFQVEEGSAKPAHDIAEIIGANLRRSGKFEPLSNRELIARPSQLSDVRFQQWRALGIDNLIIGAIRETDDGRYELRFELLDVYTQARVAGRRYRVSPQSLRPLAHNISDIIYEALTGVPGAFNTRISYIEVDHRDDNTRRHKLILADADGHNPETVLTSRQPIMSPAWSPDRRQIAYVSFEENRRSAVYIQTVATGERERIASFRGINSAPAWSPDGKRLALTLSRDGSPNIYVYDVDTRDMTRITNSSAIDTEPTWSPDGKTLYFTSDRGGPPQIYRVSSNGGRVQRVTFEGSYNARPALSPDGRRLAMVHRDDGGFRIAVMDLRTRELRVLTDGSNDESPSFAPNGEMIVYSRIRGAQSQLATVSLYGRANIGLPVLGDRVQNPSWSPR